MTVFDKTTKKFEAITRTFLMNSDIAILMDCAATKAVYYRKKFLEAYDIENKYFRASIPTKDFLKFYKIDADQIRANYQLLFQIERGLENERI